MHWGEQMTAHVRIAGRELRSLHGRVAIVTGSTSGIGLGIAEALAARGAAVVLNGLGDAAAIEATRADLAERHGVDAVFHGADMTDAAAVADLVGATASRFGRVDILVNNAGIQHVAPVEEFPPAKWDAILAINLSSAFHTIRAAVPHMKREGWGRIVNVASAHGLVASPFKSAYVAAKHGLVGLTKTVALELAETGITVNAVCPGYVSTPLVEAQIEGQAKAHGIPREEVVKKIFLAKQPNKRFVTVEELGGTVAFLVSPDAASTTGATITVDGGWTAE
jgi:3-hydroxybutyrate dehydrogenase